MQSCVKRNLQGAQNFAGVFTAQVGGKFHWPMARNLRKKKTQPPLEVLDVKGLCEEWDACEEIRDRLRQGHTFLHPDTKDTVDGCCKNSAILVPILTSMAVLEFKSLPPVDPLRVEIDDLLVKNKRGNAPEQENDVVKASWRVKKLCSFVKMKTRREEVSTVT